MEPLVKLGNRQSLYFKIHREKNTSFAENLNHVDRFSDPEWGHDNFKDVIEQFELIITNPKTKICRRSRKKQSMFYKYFAHDELYNRWKQ